MNQNLPYYDYSRCFAHYTERIMSIRQAKIRGEVIVAKPALMLVLIVMVLNRVCSHLQ